NKILLNTKTSQTLEQIAQTIFKSWLVDFDPVKAKMNGEQPKGMDAATASLFPEKLVESELGLIPDGWVVGELSKLFELHRGFDLPKSKRQQGGYPVYAAGGYHGNHNEFKMEPPGIITGRSGVIGNVYLSLDKYWPLNTTLYVREFRACGPYYAYHLLRSLDLKSLNSGSAVPSLNRNFVHSTSVCHPDSEILAKFEEIVKPLFEKMVANNEQNKSLSELRDALLPKLLSGEIDLDASGSFAVDKLVGALLEQLDFGIEFKLSQQSLPKGYIGLITVSGTFGSNGGTHVHVPTAVKALSKLTTAEGTYGEIVGNVATETLTSGAVELVTNNIIPLGVLTKVCTAVFGKKTPIKPKDAVLLTTIHEATNKSIDGILNEQAKRFAFLELPCMDEQELEQSLQYLESIGVVKCNGKTIVLLDSIVQH
ncbi:restriction endonuclease subunit S, partial [Vibrio crassostreae]